MNPYKSICVLMDLNGSLRVLIKLDASSLVFMGPNKSLCVFMDCKGCL